MTSMKKRRKKKKRGKDNVEAQPVNEEKSKGARGTIDLYDYGLNFPSAQ